MSLKGIEWWYFHIKSANNTFQETFGKNCWQRQWLPNALGSDWVFVRLPHSHSISIISNFTGSVLGSRSEQQSWLEQNCRRESKFQQDDLRGQSVSAISRPCRICFNPLTVFDHCCLRVQPDWSTLSLKYCGTKWFLVSLILLIDLEFTARCISVSLTVFVSQL